jgi:hypothetical protein
MDTSAAWKRLTGGYALTIEECEVLVKRVEALERGLAYLASCQAATMENLPPRTSKAERRRHVELTRIAAELVIGDTKSIRHPTTVDAARRRCLEAIRAEIPT